MVTNSSLIERLREFDPKISKAEPCDDARQKGLWKVFDSGGNLTAYAFEALAPEAVGDASELEDMDRYEVLGLVDPMDYRVLAIDISLAPGGSDRPWDPVLIQPEFENRYVGLSADEIKLSPEGKIDAVTDATLSSRWITEAVHRKVKDVVEWASASQGSSR